jgi:signal transduction histidine kinase
VSAKSFGELAARTRARLHAAAHAMLTVHRAVRSSAVVWLATFLAVATAGLLIVGYLAIREWTRGTELLLRQRGTETLALLGSAFHRDMEGAWKALLVPLSSLALDNDPPYDLYEPVARSFARFPYLESVVTWKSASRGESTYLFNRSERRPKWATDGVDKGPFPVELEAAPKELRAVLDDMRTSNDGRVIAYRNVTLDGTPYQVIAHLLYSSTTPHSVVAMGAITINVEWVRREYFGTLISETVRLAKNQGAVAVTVDDNRGTHVAQVGTPLLDKPIDSRSFDFLFMDAALVPRQPNDDVAEWSVSVAPAQDDTLSSALQNAHRAFILLVISAAAATLALLLTVRAVRARAQIAAMQSEFVASVTHELKTPLVVVRLVGDTLASNRYTSEDTIREYARLLSQEASRLSRTFDRLLAYVRQGNRSVSERVTQLTDLADLVDAALEEFAPILEQKGFDAEMNVPHGLPKVMVERDAVIHGMQTVIDNAIKYSGESRTLRVTAQANGRRVAVVFSDTGIGIEPVDLPHVLNRFYRGRNTSEQGTGLGLAIATRVMKAQSGTIHIASTPGQGTSVTLTFPIAG